MADIRQRKVFPTKNELSVALAEYTANLSAKFCKKKGLFTVVLSGGGLIDWLCKLLQPPYVDSVEWSKWHVFWVDERVCSDTDPDSNYKLAMDGFLSKAKMADIMQRKRKVFPTKNELSVALAEYTANLSAKFCKKKGLFTVVLSGGGLIDWLCKLLQPPYIDSVEWSKWHVFWVDERVCSETDPDSNYKLAMDGFLSKVGIPYENIHAIDKHYAADGNAEHCAALYEECLRNLVNQNIIPICAKTGYPQFDLQLLGMGPDGHMASLFPGHPQINVTDKWVTYITDSPKLPPKRITFTLPVINSASYNLMAVCDDHTDVCPRSIAEIMKKNNLALPAAHLTAQVEAMWYLDQAAASLL